jgi:SAM-dependent methyltransferase
VLRAEAAWLERELRQLPAADLSPLLSVGSGHAELTADQPWIHDVVYRPLSERGVRVLHHELEPGPGVDIAGDLSDPATLHGLEVRSVMCCNVLEHLPDAAAVARTIAPLVAPGGYAIVTVPRRYPYHPGPIDTMLRPSPEELRAFFPSLQAQRVEEIRCESLLAYLLRSPHKRTAIARGLRSFTHRRDGAAVPARDSIRMLAASTAVSAVVLRRE